MYMRGALVFKPTMRCFLSLILPGILQLRKSDLGSPIYEEIAAGDF